MPLDISIRDTLTATRAPATPAQRRLGNSSEAESPASGAARGIRDTVSFSAEAKAAQKGATPGAAQELSDDEKAQIAKLKATDQRVRQHEQAHLAASGGNARGGATYTYTTGPDGKQYATGGEVSIDVSPASTPQATIQKMQTVMHAAVAPADPSSADRAVYARAQQLAQEAQRELAQQRQDGSEGAQGGRVSGAAGGSAIAVAAANYASESAASGNIPVFNVTV